MVERIYEKVRSEFGMKKREGVGRIDGETGDGGDELVWVGNSKLMEKLTVIK